MPFAAALVTALLTTGQLLPPDDPAWKDPAFVALLGRVERCDVQARADKPCPIRPDFEVVCDVALRAFAGQITPLEGVRRVIAEVRTSTGVKAFQALGMADIPDKHAALLERARRAGLPDYRCVGLDAALVKAAAND